MDVLEPFHCTIDSFTAVIVFLDALSSLMSLSIVSKGRADLRGWVLALVWFTGESFPFAGFGWSYCKMLQPLEIKNPISWLARSWRGLLPTVFALWEM